MRTNNIGKKTLVRKTFGDRIFDSINTGFWIVFLFAILFPLWFIMIASVSDPDAVIAGSVLFWPKDFSLIGYEAVFEHKELLRSYANSIYYTLAGSALSVIVTMMAAYALTRKFPGKKIVSFLFVF